MHVISWLVVVANFAISSILCQMLFVGVFDRSIGARWRDLSPFVLALGLSNGVAFALLWVLSASAAQMMLALLVPAGYGLLITLVNVVERSWTETIRELRQTSSLLTDEIIFLRKQIDRMQLEQESSIEALRLSVPTFADAHKDCYVAFRDRNNWESTPNLETLREVSKRLQQ
ncbi:MAG TPA: hypothetical protein VGG56_14745 [Terracidiphilus sp.]|jgi:hypothetical protein